MNTCEAVLKRQHQNLAMPAVQIVQYELKHTPSLLDMTVQRTGQTIHCTPLTTRLTQQPEKRDHR